MDVKCTQSGVVLLCVLCGELSARGKDENLRLACLEHGARGFVKYCIVVFGNGCFP